MSQWNLINASDVSSTLTFFPAPTIIFYCFVFDLFLYFTHTLTQMSRTESIGIGRWKSTENPGISYTAKTQLFDEIQNTSIKRSKLLIQLLPSSLSSGKLSNFSVMRVAFVDGYALFQSRSHYLIHHTFKCS